MAGRNWWRRLALSGIIAAGLCLRLIVAWTDTPALVSKALADDAFYYFVVVEKAVAGQGVTFDGLAPTNGFHPLWALLLAPILTLTPTRDLGLHLALTLAALLDAATIYLAYGAARRLAGGGIAAGLWAAALYAFNPRLILENINGLETAASTLAFALFAAYALKLRPAPPTAKSYLFLGALAGLAAWGRTDALLAVGVVGLDILIRRRARAFVPLACMGVALLLVLSPWLLWNQLTFGTPLQTSGVAVPYVVRTYLFELSALAGALRLLGPYLYLASELAQMLIEYAGLPLAILLAYLLWRLTRGRQVSEGVAQTGWLAPLLGAGLIVAAHAFVRFFLRGWYFIPLVFALSVSAGVLLARLAETLAGRPRRVFEFGGAVIIAGLLIIGGVRLWPAGAYPWQSAMLEAALWAGEHTEPDATIGAFNAGIMGWFSGRRTLNLDGVVSEPAFAAIRQRQLLSFIRRHGVDYIIDMRSSVEETYAPFFEPGYRDALEPLQRFEAPPGSGVWDMLIAYRVKP